MKKLLYSVLLLHLLVIFDISAACCARGRGERFWSHNNPNWSGSTDCGSFGWREADNHECCAAEYFAHGTTSHSECLEYVNPNREIGRDGHGCLVSSGTPCPKTYCDKIGPNLRCAPLNRYTYNDTDLSYRG